MCRPCFRQFLKRGPLGVNGARLFGSAPARHPDGVLTFGDPNPWSDVFTLRSLPVCGGRHRTVHPTMEERP